MSSKKTNNLQWSLPTLKMSAWDLFYANQMDTTEIIIFFSEGLLMILYKYFLTSHKKSVNL